MNTLPLDHATVAAIERRYVGTQIGRLAESHQTLEAMLEEACQTIAEMNGTAANRNSESGTADDEQNTSL